MTSANVVNVVRVKRKLSDDPASAIAISCKKSRLSEGNDHDQEFIDTLEFLGTYDIKVGARYMSDNGASC